MTRASHADHGNRFADDGGEVNVAPRELEYGLSERVENFPPIGGRHPAGHRPEPHIPQWVRLSYWRTQQAVSVVYTVLDASCITCTTAQA
jgi:hypothetical protein